MCSYVFIIKETQTDIDDLSLQSDIKYKSSFYIVWRCN